MFILHSVSLVYSKDWNIFFLGLFCCVLLTRNPEAANRHWFQVLYFIVLIQKTSCVCPAYCVERNRINRRKTIPFRLASTGLFHNTYTLFLLIHKTYISISVSILFIESIYFLFVLVLFLLKYEWTSCR